jgi:sensor domain CHASE-containing protein
LGPYTPLLRHLARWIAQIERQDTQQNVRRVVEAYKNELVKLKLMNADEAEWDGSYAAVESGDQKYFTLLSTTHR